MRIFIEAISISNQKVYYGWWIVGGAIICQFTATSLTHTISGIFLNPVVNELGWQVWQYTLGPSLGMVVGSLAGIIAGQIVDRHGPRILMLIGAFVAAVSFVMMSQMSQVWVYWFCYFLAGMAGWNFFGPLIVNATLNKWFVRKRGWALAIGSVGISLSGLITPLVMTAVVDHIGWRNSYWGLAGFVLVMIVPVSFVMRRTPEDYGLLPDGYIEGEEIVANKGKSSVDDSYSFTRQEAVRTSGFWLLIAGFGFAMAALSSVIFHAMPFVTGAGFSRQVAALALSVNGLGNLISKGVWGYCLERIVPKKLVVFAWCLSALGVGFMVLATQGGAIVFLFVGFFIYGFGFGGTVPLGESLWSHYFGRTHIGAVRGIGQPLTLLGPVACPVLVGLWYDQIGSYQFAFVALIGLYLIGALLVGISLRPFKQVERAVKEL